jgi:uncharacterized damage-inducible protein DinB
MNNVYAQIFELLESLHMGIKEAIAELPQEAIDWSPGEGINSLGVLVIHTAGAERYWIGDVIGRDPSGRVRDDEFIVEGLSAANLFKRLDEVFSHSQRTLATLELEDLDSVCTSPRDGRKLSVAWCLAHALEHTALHLGHIQITKQWWQQIIQK